MLKNTTGCFSIENIIRLLHFAQTSHPFSRDLLSTYCMPGTTWVCLRNIKIPVFVELRISFLHSQFCPFSRGWGLSMGLNCPSSQKWYLLPRLSSSLVKIWVGLVTWLCEQLLWEFRPDPTESCPQRSLRNPPIFVASIPHARSLLLSPHISPPHPLPYKDAPGAGLYAVHPQASISSCLHLGLANGRQKTTEGSHLFLWVPFFLRDKLGLARSLRRRYLSERLALDSSPSLHPFGCGWWQLHCQSQILHWGSARSPPDPTGSPWGCP